MLLEVAKKKEPTNPFYVLVVVLGTAFVLTACAYGTMTYRAVRASRPQPGDAVAQAAENPLMKLMNERGLEIMVGQLVLLGVATFGAMWLDQVRSNREARSRAAEPVDTTAGPAP